MTDKITELKKEQEEKLQEYKEKWLSIGLSTQKINREKAGAAIDLVYSCAGLEPPKIKIWLRSPYEGVIGVWWLRQVLKTLRGKALDQARAKITAKVGEQAGDMIGEHVRAGILAKSRNQINLRISSRVEAQIKEQIGEPIKDQVKDRIWNHVLNQIKDQVKPQIEDTIWTQVWIQVWTQVWTQVWAEKASAGIQLGTQIRNEILAQVREQVKSQIEDILSFESHCDGLHEANLLAPYDFMSMELGVNVKKLSGLIAAAEHCGWFWPLDGAVIITEKPTELCYDDKNRLHNEKDMTIKYNDGWGIWLWYGMRVEDWIITNPERLTLDNILDEKNAGVRRVMRERFGFQDFFMVMIKEGKTKKIGRRKDNSGMPMTLYRYDEKEAPVYFVHVLNGEKEPDGTRREFLINCKNVYDDPWDSMTATYPKMMKELKDNPRKFEIIKNSIRG
ncbi:MAG: hypothetical protein KAH96_05005 [Alphaproteobacteria bacterium]|nr:hypothetical protein [Alphaproteobacteria bacterium]